MPLYTKCYFCEFNVTKSRRTAFVIRTLGSTIKKFFEIIVYSHTVVRDDTERSHAHITHFPSTVTLYVTIIHDHARRLDVGASHRPYSDAPRYVLVCACVCRCPVLGNRISSADSCDCHWPSFRTFPPPWLLE